MRRIALAAVIAFGAVAPATALADLGALGNACTVTNGVRFCPTVDLSARTPSFDGTPIDVDVTLPATGNGPWPTLVMIHGYGGSKTSLETSGAGSTNGYNNVSFAKRGYAVMNVSMRGFGRSCGHDPATRTAGCTQGYVHLGDSRFEARDVQTLLGRLVDQGIADPNKIASTGVSYGGGISLELAFLKNRVRNASGSFSTWKSPGGKSMSIAAAWPRIPWSDLASALTPNGRFLDFDSATAGLSVSPIGVAIDSYIANLYNVGNNGGWYAPQGTDPKADITGWRILLYNGEPYGPTSLAALKEVQKYHSGYGVGGKPAPLLIENGWTDSLFPPAEALRIYTSQRKAGNTDVTLLFNDLGHPAAQNKDDQEAFANANGAAFLDSRLKGIAGGPAAGSATSMAVTCPKSAASGDAKTASSWWALRPGAVSLTSNQVQTILSTGGDKDTALDLDPLLGKAGVCGTSTDFTDSGIASYTRTSPGFTMLGLPTIKASIKATGSGGMIAARLWDVMPDGKRRMVTRGVYRLKNNQSGTIYFQLHGSHYSFPSGDTIKLELLGKDPAYYRTSNLAFSVKVNSVTMELPTLDPSNPAQGITTPVIGAFKR